MMPYDVLMVTCKVKVKVTLVQTLRLCKDRTAHRGSRGITILFHDQRHQKGVRCQRHAPSALYPQKRPGTHCTGGWVGHRTGMDRYGKSRPPPGFDPRTVHTVASRYNGYAIRPTMVKVTIRILQRDTNLLKFTSFLFLYVHFEQKISPTTGLDPRTVHPVASRYNGYAIRPTMVEGTIRILQRDTNLLKFTSFVFLYVHFEPLFRIYMRERPRLLVSVHSYIHTYTRRFVS
jgi:hypothetical protein